MIESIKYCSVECQKIEHSIPGTIYCAFSMAFSSGSGRAAASGRSSAIQCIHGWRWSFGGSTHDAASRAPPMTACHSGWYLVASQTLASSSSAVEQSFASISGCRKHLCHCRASRFGSPSEAFWRCALRGSGCASSLTCNAWSRCEYQSRAAVRPSPWGTGPAWRAPYLLDCQSKSLSRCHFLAVAQNYHECYRR